MQDRRSAPGSHPGQCHAASPLPPAAPAPDALASQLQRIDLIIAERERVGCDLHDNLNNFAAVGLMLESLRRRVAPIDEEAAATATRAQRLLHAAIDEARRISHALAPPYVFDGDLQPALEAVIHAFALVPNVQVALSCPTPCPLASSAAVEHLSRIAQEAIQNAIRHGHARSIRLCVNRGENDLEMIVADDGWGLPEANEISHGLGLKLMRHRAALIGGTVEVRRGDPAGTLVVCRLPTATKPADDPALRTPH